MQESQQTQILHDSKDITVISNPNHAQKTKDLWAAFYKLRVGGECVRGTAPGECVRGTVPGESPPWGRRVEIDKLLILGGINDMSWHYKAFRLPPLRLHFTNTQGFYAI